mgnify:CR=1 FL=1
MHKKLASDLTSLAHSILQMKNKEDVFELKKKSYEIYEKLAVLAYVEEYINNTPNPIKTKAVLLEEVALAAVKKSESEDLKIMPLEEEEPVFHKLEDVVEDDKLSTDETKTIVEIKEEVVVEEVLEQPFDELKELLFEVSENSQNSKNDVKDVGDKKTPTLEDELQDTISVDVMADLFEKAVPKKSLNDRFQKTIQIDLNDRIAFVKHLFDGDQGDFNRVVSQLNTFKTEKEAKKFITKMVKPDYNWSEKEEFEVRLYEIIERRFV